MLDQRQLCGAISSITWLSDLDDVLIYFIKFFENAFPMSLRSSLRILDAHLLLMCCGGIFRLEKMYNQYVDLAQTCVCSFSLIITDLT